MFSRYISKITNTIGTVNYLQQKSKKNCEQQHYSHLRQSSKQISNDDDSDVEDDDSETNNNHIDIDLSHNRGRTLIDNFATESQIILTAAIAKLRNTLFAYELV